MALANTPPGVRLSSPRETIPFLASYQQVGLPAVAASDAQLGHSVYTYQSGEAAFGMCGADSHVLWRVVGQHGRAHGQTGSKTLVTQRARVGFCPGCSTVTQEAGHVDNEECECEQSFSTTLDVGEAFFVSDERCVKESARAP